MQIQQSHYSISKMEQQILQSLMVAMYNAYQKEYNYDVVANQISDEDAKAIADNSYAYYIFPKDQEELRDKVDEQLKELKKDGTLSKLSQKYFGQDTAPEDDQFEKTPN